MKRFLLPALILLAALLLTGCGSIFEAEYVVESSFEPESAVSRADEGETTVHSIDELKETLLSLVESVEDTHRIFFDASYTGDVSDDLASACWQVRTEDALCAYCVENISYSLSRIGNTRVAYISVSYGVSEEDIDSVVRIPVASDAADLLRDTMDAGRSSLILLSEYSWFTPEDMAEFTQDVYRRSPHVAPDEPTVSVDMFSGADNQRLYVLLFDYGMDAQTFASRCAELDALDPFDGVDTADLSEGERALLACRTLTQRCRFDKSADNSIYAALIENRADSLGMALAYVELCRRLGLDCQVVEGQYNRADHWWTLVGIDGAYYHVDPSHCTMRGFEEGFLLTDETAWGPYRWDYFAYPHSVGSLHLSDLLIPSDEKTTEEEEKLTEEPEEENNP